MHFSRLCAFFATLLCAVFLFYLPASAKTPTLSAECSCLYLENEGLVLYEKNARRRHAMASTTKIMTALVVLENSALTDTFPIPKEAVGIEGSSVYLTAGEVQTVENLLYALMLASANDAAAALAIHVGGSIEGFADLMNARAAALSLSDTHFTNPHGLADKEHYTSAYDLSLITAEAMKNPDFCRIVSTKNKVITVQNGQGARSLSNHNRLLRSLEDCVGVKTGFTKASGRCLVSAVNKNGMLTIAVTLDAPNDWEDHRQLHAVAFSQYTQKTLDAVSFEIPVLAGEKEYVGVTSEAKTYLLPKGKTQDVRVECNRFAVAPIQAGDVLGRVRVFVDGKETLSLPIRATKQVAAVSIRLSFFDRIKNFFNL